MKSNYGGWSHITSWTGWLSEGTRIPLRGVAAVPLGGGGLSQIGTVLFPFEEAVLGQIRFYCGLHHYLSFIKFYTHTLLARYLSLIFMVIKQFFLD